MVSIPTYLQIFNPAQNDGPFSSFLHFSRFPHDVRLRIWELALQRERFFQLRLSDQNDKEMEPMSRKGYLVTVKGRKIISKILHINSEARYVALRFYHIQIPCQYQWGGIVQRDSIIYINSDMDILFIDDDSEVPRLVEFLLDVQFYDRLRIGLRNLAFTGHGLRPTFLAQNSSAATTDLASAISSLKQVFFACVEEHGRLSLGPRNGGIETMPNWRFFRSRPILGSVAGFNRIPHDPRPVSRHLRHVYSGFFDPLRNFYSWLNILAELGIRREEAGIQYRFIVSHYGDNRCGSSHRNSEYIIDRASAAKFVQEEENIWIENQNACAESILARGRRVPLESARELARSPQPAVGFWIFPIEALGPLPEPGKSEDVSHWPIKRVVDMSSYWPQLCLSDLS